MIKKIMFVLLGVLVLFVCFIFYEMKQTTNYAQVYHTSTMKMENIEDGYYEGESLWGLVKVRVGVVVQNHFIASIEILHHEFEMGEKAEEITERIIKENDVNVEVISGATISSKAIQNAIQSALQ